jgi:hypothetical protein
MEEAEGMKLLDAEMYVSIHSTNGLRTSSKFLSSENAFLPEINFSNILMPVYATCVP